MAEAVDTLADVATGPPLNGTISVAGPDVFPLDELGRLTLRVRDDRRSVVTDESAGLFAAVPTEAIIAPADARIGRIRYTDWLG